MLCGHKTDGTFGTRYHVLHTYYLVYVYEVCSYRLYCLLCCTRYTSKRHDSYCTTEVFKSSENRPGCRITALGPQLYLPVCWYLGFGTRNVLNALPVETDAALGQVTRADTAIESHVWGGVGLLLGRGEGPFLSVRRVTEASTTTVVQRIRLPRVVNRLRFSSTAACH